MPIKLILMPSSIYNDYNYYRDHQCESVVKLIQNLQSKGIRVDGIGIQGHWGIDYPNREEIENVIRTLSKPSIKLMITELDATVLPFAEELFKYFNFFFESRNTEKNKSLCERRTGFCT